MRGRVQASTCRAGDDRFMPGRGVGGTPLLCANHQLLFQPQGEVLHESLGK
jgi:hypothetical protein